MESAFELDRGRFRRRSNLLLPAEDANHAIGGIGSIDRAPRFRRREKRIRSPGDLDSRARSTSWARDRSRSLARWDRSCRLKELDPLPEETGSWCGELASRCGELDSVRRGKRTRSTAKSIPRSTDGMCTDDRSRSDRRGIWIGGRRRRSGRRGKRCARSRRALSPAAEALLTAHWFEAAGNRSGPARGEGDPGGARVRCCGRWKAVPPAGRAILWRDWFDRYGRQERSLDRGTPAASPIRALGRPARTDPGGSPRSARHPASATATVHCHHRALVSPRACTHVPLTLHRSSRMPLPGPALAMTRCHEPTSPLRVPRLCLRARRPRHLRRLRGYRRGLRLRVRPTRR